MTGSKVTIVAGALAIGLWGGQAQAMGGKSTITRCEGGECRTMDTREVFAPKPAINGPAVRPVNENWLPKRGGGSGGAGGRKKRVEEVLVPERQK